MKSFFQKKFNKINYKTIYSVSKKLTEIKHFCPNSERKGKTQLGITSGLMIQTED